MTFDLAIRSANGRAGSIRLLFALWYARLARALDDALKLRVEGRIVAPVVYPTLNGEVGIEFQHLGCGLLRLLHVAEPAVGGGEVGVRPLSLIAAGDRLVAPFDRLLPVRKMGVQVANISIATTSRRIARAQPQGGLDPREAILGAAEKHFIEAGLGMGGCVVAIVGDRLFRLGDRRRPTGAYADRPAPLARWAAELSG